MADIVGSLFGLSPDLVRANIAKENEARAQFMAQNAPTGYGNIVYGASKLGQNIGGAVQGLLGIEDPTLKKATKLEQVLQITQNNLGEGVTDPTKLYPELVKNLRDAGLEREATQASIAGYGEIQDWNKTQAAIKKDEALATKTAKENDPKEKAFWTLAGSGKVSPESIKLAIENGMDFSKLDINDREKKSAMAQQLIDAGYKEGSAEYQAKMKEFIESEIKGKSKGEGNVTIGGINVDTGKASEAAGKVIGEAVANIENKYSALDSLQEAKVVLSKGINGGIYGPAKQFITKATGGLIGSPEKVRNTEEFLSYIGNTVVPRLKEFGGNDSNEELKYLQSIMGGQQSLEPESMKNILESAERKINRGIERLKRQAESANKKENGKPLPLPIDAGPSREESNIPKPKKRKYVIGVGFQEAD